MERVKISGHQLPKHPCEEQSPKNPRHPESQSCFGKLFHLAVFTIIVTIAIGVLRSEAKSILWSAAVSGTPFETSWLISMGKFVISLLILWVVVGLSALALVLISAAIRFVLYRFFKVNCLYSALVGIYGFALAPMALLPLATLYPLVILLFLVWSVILTVFGISRALSTRVAKTVLVEVMALLIVAAIMAVVCVTGRVCFDRWEARIAHDVMVKEAGGATRELLRPGTRVRIFSHAGGNALAVVVGRRPGKNQVAFAWIPGNRLRFRQVAPVEFADLELRHLGLRLWETVLSFSRLIGD